jgi:hypothetical protein
MISEKVKNNIYDSFCKNFDKEKDYKISVKFLKISKGSIIGFSNKTYDFIAKGNIAFKYLYHLYFADVGLNLLQEQEAIIGGNCDRGYAKDRIFYCSSFISNDIYEYESPVIITNITTNLNSNLQLRRITKIRKYLNKGQIPTCDVSYQVLRQIKNYAVNLLYNDLAEITSNVQWKKIAESESESIKKFPNCAGSTAQKDVCYNSKDLNGSLLDLNSSLNEVCQPFNPSRAIATNVQQNNSVNLLNLNKNNKKEKKTMNFMKNFNFGKYTSRLVKQSYFGTALLRANASSNTYVVYDPNKNEFTDVGDFIIDDFSMFYQIPVSLKDIAVGDIILHNEKPVIVKEVPTGSKSGVKVIEALNSEIVEIVPEKNLFGFNFYTKIISLMGNVFSINNKSPINESNPFGNIPMMMMLMNKDSGDKDNLFEILMMSQIIDEQNPLRGLGAENERGAFTPLMLMMLSDKNSGDDDIFKNLFMMNMFNGVNSNSVLCPSMNLNKSASFSSSDPTSPDSVV